MSKQGVQQGDPLGSLLFAIAIHDSIMAVHSLHGVVWSGWFADDGTIQAPLPVLECALTTLSTSLAAHNITINFAKTKIVTQDPRSVDFYDTLRGLVRVPLANGFPLLGGHIPGSTLPSFLTARLEEFRLLCSKIGQLPEAHIAFTLLRSCTYACRVNHILRMIPPSCLVTWNVNLTAILRSTVSKLIDGHISERAWIQCIQPIKLGGLGYLTLLTYLMGHLLLLL